jgi:uncharacterized protein (DUF486 family)
MRTIFVTATLLSFSNLFMTFAWYGHLKNLSDKNVASDIVEAIRMNDQRFGVEPKERVKRRAKKL